MMDFLKENSLYFLFGLGMVLCFFWLRILRNYLYIKWQLALLLAVLAVLFAGVFVTLFSLIEGKAGGMNIFGGIFFMPLFFYASAKICKLPVDRYFDIFTPCTVSVALIAKFNCIISGCCRGKILCFSSGKPVRWPVRVTEILFCFLMLLILALWFFKDSRKGNGTGKTMFRPGMLYPFYMMAYGIFRFGIEFFRESASNSLFHLNQLWAIIAFIIGLSLFTEIKQQSKKKRNKS